MLQVVHIAINRAFEVFDDGICTLFYSVLFCANVIRRCPDVMVSMHTCRSIGTAYRSSFSLLAPQNFGRAPIRRMVGPILPPANYCGTTDRMMHSHARRCLESLKPWPSDRVSCFCRLRRGSTGLETSSCFLRTWSHRGTLAGSRKSRRRLPHFF